MNTLQIDHHRLADSLDAVCQKWDISGSLFLVDKAAKYLYNRHFGFSDRDHHLKTNPKTRYALDAEAPFLVKLCAFHLIDRGQLKATDKLEKHLPEYTLGKDITIKHLIKDNSGIPDFYFSGLMKAFEDNPKHKQLPHDQRIPLEKLSLYESRSYPQVLEFIKSHPLDYLPGTLDREGSLSNTVVLAEVLRRITQKTLRNYLIDDLLKPFDIEAAPLMEGQVSDLIKGGKLANPYCTFRRKTLIRIPLDALSPQATGSLFTLDQDQASRLVHLLASGRLFGPTTWDQLLKLDKNGLTPLFENANGYYCANIELMDTGLYFYFNPQSGLAFASLVNEAQKFENHNNQWYYYRKAAREAVAAATTFPTQTRYEKLNRENLWHALELQVEDTQKEFVLEAKSSIAMGLLYPTKVAFAQMEGHLCVGLLVLDINPKKAWYNIDIIIIDKQFQGRGYGKHMVKWALDYLKKAGAKELNIGVSRYNYGAQKIYMAAGFSTKTVYNEGMTLSMTL